MGHITSKSYLELQKRLNLAPQGVPASDTLFKILEILFTEKEAKLVSVLPIKIFPLKKAAEIWKMQISEAKEILDELAAKGLMFDIGDDYSKLYFLAPPMAGFFEFSIMRLDGRFDKKVLSELYHQYINVEEDFTNEVFNIFPTLGRTLVQETAIQEKDEVHILDYERATKIIDSASCITVGTCYCRHKKEHLGTPCKNPQKVCLTLNTPAKSLAKHGIAKEITKEEAHIILKKSIDLGLVQIGDNVQNKVGWICNCCSCCCDALQAYKRLGYANTFNSNFQARVTNDTCKGCGICVKKCPVDAIKLEKIAPKKLLSVVDKERCIGCGVCARFCKHKSMQMERRARTKFVPKNSFERYVLTATYNGKLQNLIFDNQHLFTSKILQSFFGIILKQKPVVQLMVRRQLKSRYFDLVSSRK